MPALFTSTSSPPWSATVLSMAACHPASSVTSRWMNSALPCAFLMSATTASPSLSRTSATTTALAPSRPNRRAVAAPMPLAAPVIRATLSFMRMVPAPFSRQLETDDPGHDQGDRRHAQRGRGIPERQDADDECADRADASPYRIGSTHGNEALCPQKQRPARRHGDDGEDDPPRPGSLVGPAKLEAQRPADLADTRQNQIEPRHLPPRPLCSMAAPSLT